MSQFESKRISEIANSDDQRDSSERNHERHTLADPRISSIKFSSDLFGSVNNLSYGGISVEFPKDQLNQLQGQFKSDRQTHEAELVLGNEKISTKLTLVRLIGRKAAFTFVHDSAETLVFLREVLESIRIGSTMKPIHGFKGDEWKDMRFTLRGDSHSELELMINREGELIFSRLTFSNQGYFFEVTFKDSRLDTGVAVINFGAAAQTQNTKELDTRLLRQSIFILLGFDNDIISEQKSDLIGIILDSLTSGRRTKEPAA